MKISRRGVFHAIGAAAAAPRPAQTAPARGPELFAFDRGANIRKEDHFGIINGLTSVGVNYRDVVTLRGLFAPPFASSNFFLELRLDGDRIRTSEYRWYPPEVRHHGSVKSIAVNAITALADSQRAGIITATLENSTAAVRTEPIQLSLTGSVDYVRFWGFPRPNTDKKTTEAATERDTIVHYNDAGAFAAACDLPGLTWEPWSSHWVTSVRLAPGQRKTFHLVFAIGVRAECVETCRRILEDPKPPKWSPTMRLTGLRLRGKALDIAVHGGSYEVRTGRKVIGGRVGIRTVVS